ncbi:response regulator [bacterium]|nr:response regulator [bacterium]
MAHILIIEDERIVRTVIKRFLEKAGHTIIEAEDGKIGLRVFKENNFDLIITDIIMPNSEGIETIANLRKEDPQMPIIAMSGGGTVGPIDYLDLARRFGAAGTYQKSANWDELVELVERLLDER